MRTGRPLSAHDRVRAITDDDGELGVLLVSSANRFEGTDAEQLNLAQRPDLQHHQVLQRARVMQPATSKPPSLACTRTTRMLALSAVGPDIVTCMSAPTTGSIAA